MVEAPDTDDLDILYKWINLRYEMMAKKAITEEVYLKELEFYKSKLGSDVDTPNDTATEAAESSQEASTKTKTSPDGKKVRSTSIADLRKKLMEELKK